VSKTYKIVFDKKAAKYFNNQSEEQRKRLASNISRLPKGDTRQLKGYKGFYRLRVGEYRVIYTIKHEELLIVILTIGNRGDIYKKI
jgi:mRNA interferase RelE/StbE